jgi:hypothetical protein
LVRERTKWLQHKGKKPPTGTAAQKFGIIQVHVQCMKNQKKTEVLTIPHEKHSGSSNKDNTKTETFLKKENPTSWNINKNLLMQ